MSSANFTPAGTTAAYAPHGFLDRASTIARPGFNRWLVPPAALAIHLCIGMIYGMSVFWLPLTHALSPAAAAACPAGTGIMGRLFSSTCNWPITDLNWAFTIAIVMLGASAAIWGGWLERAGPRKAGLVAAICWSGGLAVGALGIALHQLWLVWLGVGVIGGVGQGLGYISPVSTLIKWFPDRRGMATGMAIMGFGGGAMIGAPLANILMTRFRGPAGGGVWQALLTLAVIYAVFMTAGALGYRVPPAGWRPEGYAPPASRASMITGSHVHLRDAHKTRSFWMIWLVLLLNVSAGIGVISMASPMLQEIFGGSLIGQPGTMLHDLTAPQHVALAAIAAGFVGLLSLFNIGGRFVWASASDRLGRKQTYAMFFLVGIVLYAASPWAAHSGHQALFVLFICIILSFYGGGFATVPAYLADVFGTQFVGAIHGRLLTAWSAAGIVGPVAIGYIRRFGISAGVPQDHLYDVTFYVLAGFLVVGFLCNLAVRPVPQRYAMSEAELAAEQSRAGETAVAGSFGIGHGALDAKIALAWLAVGIPIAWGVYITLTKALILF